MIRTKLARKNAAFEDICRYATYDREPFFRIALDYLSPTQRCLDIGAGMGLFADMLGSDDIHLIEGNPESAERLRQRYRNVHEVSLPAEFPFTDGYFDLIHCSHVIEHLYPDQLYEVLKEMDRCLAPGGHLVISTPLMWEGFFADLSHVKPYLPNVLLKYLGDAQAAPKVNMTRTTLSKGYTLARLVYRYRRKKIPMFSVSRRKSIQRLAFWFSTALVALDFSVYEQTGYTAVLKKNADSIPSLASARVV